ncbi:MAG: VCBS repeat-containing protein, partial [Planctomycetota bacterium]|nr:VCBS repeat-containing protein [Planctomycetota bacterium]
MPGAQDAHDDDEIIGVAFRRSLAVIAGVGAVVGVIAAMGGDEPEPERIREKDVGAIETLETEVESLPSVRFTDVTAASGIDFVHTTGAAGSKLLPETMGGGAAFFDHDLDGDQDLLLVNGREWPEDGGAAPGHRLYENDGAGAFTDVSEAVGIGPGGYGMGCAVGDVDGDGDFDLFITGVGGNQLLIRDGERYVDRTAASGLGGSPDAWSTSAGFFDMDGDGDLDLFVCHYVMWSRAIDEELAYTLNGADRAYGPPMNYRGAFSSLYRNDGAGVFEDVSEASGIRVQNPATGEPMGKALGIAFLDVEGDGDTDVFVANDTVQNHLFINDGAGSFTEEGAQTGFAFDRNGGATGAMGIDVGDFRQDGSYGVCIG